MRDRLATAFSTSGRVFVGHLIKYAVIQCRK
jgi:hypothetical protein